MKTPLNLGKVLRLGFIGFTDSSINIFLTGHNHPRPALTQATELLNDGLQGEHHLRVVANKLPHLIHQEDNAMAGWLGRQVVPNDFCQSFDVDFVIVARIIEPKPGRLLGHIQ